MRFYILLCFFFLIYFGFAQNERSMVRDGNKNYNKGLFSDSEINYRKSLSQKKGFEEAQFNLSDALFKQERYDESIELLNNLISETQNNSLKAESYYNLGNNLLQQQKLEEAIDAYKNSLRINPADEEARYNLSKAISLMQQQKNQNEQEQDDNNQEQDDNQEEKDQNSGETDSEEEDENESKDKNNNSDQESEQDESRSNDTQQGELSRDEIERILDALEREEQKTQEDVQKMQQTSKKKLLEKDW